MTEQEYKEKLQVREQLSQLDRLRVLEYEVLQIKEQLKRSKEILHVEGSSYK
jgi:hypothetical protein